MTSQVVYLMLLQTLKKVEVGSKRVKLKDTYLNTFKCWDSVNYSWPNVLVKNLIVNLKV